MLEKIVTFALSVIMGACSGIDENGELAKDATSDYLVTVDSRAIGSNVTERNAFESEDGKVYAPPSNDELCEDGREQKTYLKDEDNDGFYAKGFIGCSLPSDGITYFLKEDVIPFNEIPLLDCNDNNTTIYPKADELCDNLDNDCDTEIDEDVTPETKPCETACDKVYQFKKCLPGGIWTADWSTCSAGIPGGEICNDYDDDCDGIKD